jgi:hypothetical protein
MPTDASAGDGSVPAADQPATDPDGDLVFAAHDIRRDRTPRPGYSDEELGFTPAALSTTGDTQLPAPDGFLINEPPGTAPRAPLDALVVGTPAPPAQPEAAPAPRQPGFHVTRGDQPPPQSTALPWTVRDTRKPTGTYRGWTSRHSELMERAAGDTLQRLREDAVHVSWKAAWIAVTSADARLYRKRDW